MRLSSKLENIFGVSFKIRLCQFLINVFIINCFRICLKKNEKFRFK